MVTVTINSAMTNNGGSKNEDGISIEETDGQFVEATLFPNPTAGPVKIWLEGLSGEENVSIEIFNPLGKSVYLQQNQSLHTLINEIDLSRLPAGEYFVNITVDGELFPKKLVLVH